MRTTAVELIMSTKICELDQDETYNYLSIEEGNGIQHSNMNEMIRKKDNRQTRAISKNRIEFS